MRRTYGSSITLNPPDRDAAGTICLASRDGRPFFPATNDDDTVGPKVGCERLIGTLKGSGSSLRSLPAAAGPVSSASFSRGAGDPFRPRAGTQILPPNAGRPTRCSDRAAVLAVTKAPGNSTLRPIDIRRDEPPGVQRVYRASDRERLPAGPHCSRARSVSRCDQPPQSCD
jgi:hypothetical protein